MSESPEIVVLRRADYRRMRWKNGAGWTTEIAQAAAGDGSFAWRVSIAEVDADGDFSAFPGVDRSLLVLSGEGMALDFGTGAPTLVRPLADAAVFAGEAAIHARLLGGPTRDFNVMTRRDRYAHGLRLRGPGEPMGLIRDSRRSWFVHVLTGAVAGVSAGDSFLLGEGPEATLELAGDATLVIVGLQRLGDSISGA
jgi:hypothetical protein